jgi:Protein of unknown function DUF262/HNH endonuclease
MKIELQKIKIGDVVKNYVDNDEEGITGYNNLLNIRPKYQREFIYNDKERKAVIDSIRRDLPLNTMYWAVNNDNSYEVLDGQQRTISICQYITGVFSIINNDGNAIYFDNLTKEEKSQILNYELLIYFCEGNDKEKLDWFKRINIASKPFNNQELRNAVYTGAWLTDAKRKFSKSNCVAYKIAKDYIDGSPIRQDYLEVAIKWISSDDIDNYMSIHQHDSNADELWTYFNNIIEWIEHSFIKYRREMKGLSWGEFYNEFKDRQFDSKELEQKINILMIDDDVTNKKGIYEYVLTYKEKHLNIRQFTESQKIKTYEKQNGICVKCNKYFEFDQTEADHITPWKEGGKTNLENCQILCRECNRKKSGN